MDSSPTKVCPLIYRKSDRGVELLAFQHPLAGKQWIKGSIEPNESPLHAAFRELKEESGIVTMTHPQDIGVYLISSARVGERVPWQLYLAHSRTKLPEYWEYHTDDDGGHVFSFFWQPVASDLTDEWHPMFHEVLAYVQQWIALNPLLPG